MGRPRSVNCCYGQPLEPGANFRRLLCRKCWQEFKAREADRSSNPRARSQARRYFEGKRPF